MPLADVHGHRLYVEDTGGVAPCVLFSHGFLLDHTIWSRQVAGLAGTARCVAHDERGHGMSDCHGTYAFDDLADDAVALLDRLGVDQAILVGHSQGGWLSMSAALRHPDRVAGLVLVDTAADLDAPEVSAHYRSWADTWTTSGPSDELVETMLAVQFGERAPEHALEWTSKWRARPPASTRDIWDSVLGRGDYAARLAEIRQPALVIHGDADIAFPLERAETIRDGLADCRGLVAIAGAPHAPSVTHADAVTDAIARFVADVGQP